MSVLSDKDIISLCRNKSAIIPFFEDQVQPASYDVKLGSTFRIMSKDSEYGVIDPMMHQPGLTEEYDAVDQIFFLRPKDFVLGITAEYVSVPDFLVARLEGKSSLGRIGLVVHSTAGWIDPGFHGNITLELANLTNKPIALTPGMPIGQICFMELSSRVDRPYGSEGLGSKYQGNTKPTESKLYTQNTVSNPVESSNPQDSGGSIKVGENVPGDRTLPSRNES